MDAGRDNPTTIAESISDEIVRYLRIESYLKWMNAYTHVLGYQR